MQKNNIFAEFVVSHDTENNHPNDEIEYWDWMKTLTSLWVIYGKTPTTTELKAYEMIMGEIPIGLLETVISQSVKKHKYKSVPTAGELWEVVQNELDGLTIEEWLDKETVKRIKAKRGKHE